MSDQREQRQAEFRRALHEISQAWSEWSLYTAVVSVCLDHGVPRAPGGGVTVPEACARALTAMAELGRLLATAVPQVAAISLEAGITSAGVCDMLGVSARRLPEIVAGWARSEIVAGRLTPAERDRLVALARGEVPS